MQKFIMLGKYSTQALQGMSVQRTQKAKDLVKLFGGEVEAMYATLGDRDLVVIIAMPGLDEALKVSVALTKLTGIGFSTSPVVSVETFDKLMSEL